MGWAVGFDSNWKRDIGYGVPSICDHSECNEEIDRGISYVCGEEAYGGEKGCGLYFCEKHLYFSKHDDDPRLCEKCCDREQPFTPSPDTEEWREWKKTDDSWKPWRDENPELARAL